MSSEATSFIYHELDSEVRRPQSSRVIRQASACSLPVLQPIFGSPSIYLFPVTYDLLATESLSPVCSSWFWLHDRRMELFWEMGPRQFFLCPSLSAKLQHCFLSLPLVCL